MWGGDVRITVGHHRGLRRSEHSRRHKTHLRHRRAVVDLGLTVTVVVHLPINKLIKSSEPGAVPVQWNELRTRWRAWNWVRCGLAVGAFLVAALG